MTWLGWEIALSPEEFARLRRVGYWRSAQEPDLPDPAGFVVPGDPVSDRDALVTYLREAPACARWAGYSTCRLCSATGADLGDADLTDGAWVWPSGLHHYVTQHAVRLPAPFMDHVRTSGFRIAKPIVPVETTEARLDAHRLRRMTRTQDGSSLRFRIDHAPGTRDLFLAVDVEGRTGAFRWEVNQAVLDAERERTARRLAPPRWRRALRLLFGL